MKKLYNKYEERIIKEVLETDHNIVINAVAGAGKTTTLLDLVEILPENIQKGYFAYNKEIADEIDVKLKRKIYPGIKDSELREKYHLPKDKYVATTHSIGYSILRENFPRLAMPVNEWKYIAKFNEIKPEDLIFTYNHNEILAYETNVKKLIDYARFYLCENEDDVREVIKHYGMKIIDNEISIVLELMEWGKSHIEEIDYTDMLWLPCVLNLETKLYRYDFLFIDEAQDLSKTQQKLIFKTLKPGGRFIAVGDDDQTINGWMGADNNAFKNYENMPNTVKLPMCTTFRCGKKIVEKANELVPSLEAREGAPDGTVEFDANIWDAKDDNDMVICRTNAPLLKAYNDFNERGIKTYWKGSEMEKTWDELLNSSKQEILSSDFNQDGVFPDLYRILIDKLDSLVREKHIDERSACQSDEIAKLLDNIESLEILAKGVLTKTALKDKIRGIMRDRNNGGVIFVTAHRSKGLTSKNVFILCPSLMPSPLATQDWEIREEKNIQYVAYTRASDKLAFVSEDKYHINNIFSNPEKVIKKINDIKKQIQILDLMPKGTKSGINRDVSGNTKTVSKRKIGAMKFSHFMK